MELALFDFDGTITTKDSWLDFIRFSKGPIRFFGGFFALSPVLFAYSIGLVKTQTAKEWVMRLFFRGMTEQQLILLGEAYVEQRLPDILCEDAVEKIKWHQNADHQVVVVTASTAYWINPWCKKMGIMLIATNLQTKNGRISGKIMGMNCQGKEKAIRIESELDLKMYTKIYGYGDSKGDFEMMALAHESHYQSFC